MKFISILLFVLSFAFSSSIYGQNPILSDLEKEQVIDSTCSLLLTNYIDLPKAEEMVNLLKRNHKRHKYDTIVEHKRFAAQIEHDLAEVAEDKHFHFMYNPEAIAKSKEEGEDATLNALLNDAHINHGFREVTILEGNVAYLKLDRIPYPSDAESAIVGAMGMMANADAMIIDLSDNRGGYNEMLQFFMSYFFEYPVLINTLYKRNTNETNQFWTFPYRDGKLLDSIDIYIVTSRRTFSAGEWLAYSMQQQGRAVVVGEVSKGGASPSEFYYVNDNFMMLVPNSSCIEPVSGTNFNNVGVQPDVKCSSRIAVDKAYQLAIQNLDSITSNAIYNKEYQWILDGLKAKIDPVSVDSLFVQKCIGSYGRSTIVWMDGDLYFKTSTGTKYLMKAISQTYYCLEGLDHFRIQFILEDNEVVGFEGVYSTGYIQEISKNRE